MLDQHKMVLLLPEWVVVPVRSAPVIAQLAKEREILTVGIVTLPFSFEASRTSAVESKNAKGRFLIVINNNKLRSIRKSWFQSRI
jgi:cell division GTPase FtsZ